MRIATLPHEPVQQGEFDQPRLAPAEGRGRVVEFLRCEVDAAQIRGSPYQLRLTRRRWGSECSQSASSVRSPVTSSNGWSSMMW